MTPINPSPRTKIFFCLALYMLFGATCMSASHTVRQRLTPADTAIQSGNVYLELQACERVVRYLEEQYLGCTLMCDTARGN